jgi:hypothetical protein
MGTRQSRSGPGQQGQPSDHRPQQDRDVQRNKQSDRGQHQQGAGEQGQRQQSQDNVHGEGNYAATRQYNEDTKKFMASGGVEPAARAAAPKSDTEARDMSAAEAEGKRHAKGEDPALNRRSSKTSPETPSAPRPGHEEK